MIMVSSTMPKYRNTNYPTDQCPNESYKYTINGFLERSVDAFSFLCLLALNRWTVGLCIFSLTWFYLHIRSKRQDLAKRIASKRVSLAQNVQAIRDRVTNWPESSDQLRQIVSLSLKELQSQLRANLIKPVSILHAYQYKALQLYEAGNSGICGFIIEAEQQAIEMEANLIRLLETSPLAGIPISIKESNCVKGYDSVIGLAKLCNQPATEDCVMVRALKESGAIPFAITHCSQVVRGLSGFNPVFGDLGNPYKIENYTGGSSSGEGCLLAQNGSLVGLGSDIGGSIRIPAAFCGLTGLKPTRGRISLKGCTQLAKETVLSIAASIGPMGRNVDEIVDFMRTILSPNLFNSDKYTVPAPFNESMYSGHDKPKLTIGYYVNLEQQVLPKTVSSVKNAVKQAVDCLKKAGHKVVVFNPPRTDYANQLFVRCMYAGGGAEFKRSVAYETLDPALRLFYMVVSLPSFLLRFVAWLASRFGARHLSALRFLAGLQKPIDALKLQYDLQCYRNEFAEAWTKAELDVVICPTFPFPAPPKSVDSSFIYPATLYTALYNLLDYPAGSQPMGWVDEASVVESRACEMECQLAGTWFQKRIEWIQRDSLGLPLAVQIVACPFREELVLRVMRQLESGMTL